MKSSSVSVPQSIFNYKTKLRTVGGSYVQAQQQINAVITCLQPRNSRNQGTQDGNKIITNI